MLRRILNFSVIFCLMLNALTPLSLSYADTSLSLPLVGTMVFTSPSFQPALIRGLTIHQDNPFLFDFIVDPGQSRLSRAALKDESQRMVQYFFASLTIPDEDIWVNLSPYEKNKIIPMALGQTLMGRDLLKEDYLLKQLSASLIYPQKDLGKQFWDKIYAQARAMYGTTDVPVNTFNKVWIVPQSVDIYEKGQTAFIVDGHLKVMLEEDYISMTKHNAISTASIVKNQNSVEVNQIGSRIIRAIILPEIEKEINQGHNFAVLRQIFYAQSLAVWFKRNLKQAVLNKVYANKNTVKGIDKNDVAINQLIFRQYLRTYKKGVFNFIQEDTDPVTQEIVPRKYFSGGYSGVKDEILTPAMLTPKAIDEADHAQTVTVALIADHAQAATLNLNADKMLSDASMTAEERYKSQITALLTRIPLWRADNMPAPALAHLDSHQAQIDELEQESLLTSFEANLMRVFVEGHDLGYGADLKNKEFMDKMQRLWERLARIVGYDEDMSKERAKRLRQFIDHYNDMDALVLERTNSLRKNSEYSEVSYEDLERIAKAQIGKEKYMVTSVILHGTASIVMVRDKLRQEGFSSEEALGWALIFAAHHPGFPVSMVNEEIIPGIIPEEFSPLLLITGDQYLAHYANDKAEWLRHQLADTAAGLLRISKAEARFYAVLGFALDRITPARIMTQFDLGNFEIREDGTVLGQAQWEDGESKKKYPLRVADTYYSDDLTIRAIFKSTVDVLKKEAEAAKIAGKNINEGLSKRQRNEVLTNRISTIIENRSNVEINKIQKMHDAILNLIAQRMLNFNGDLTNIDPLIRQAIVFYKGLREDASERPIIEYLLGFLITIKTSPLAQNNIKFIKSGEKKRDYVGQAYAKLADLIVSGYVDISTLNQLMKVDEGEIIHKNVGDVIIKQGDEGTDMFFIIEGTAKVDIDGVEVNTVSKGAILGEVGAIQGTRSATVTATSSTVLVRMTKEYVNKLTNGNSFPLNMLMNTRVFLKPNPAMKSADIKPMITPGGIDLSAQDAALRVVKDANGGVKVTVDPSLTARIEYEGMIEADPVIIAIQPASAESLFGKDIL